MLFLRQSTQYYSKFLFVVGPGDVTLRSFSIDENTGALTQVSVVNPTIAGLGIDIHPTLPYIYQARNGTPDGVQAFRFDQTTGALTSAGAVNTGSSFSHRVRVLQDGSALFFNTVQCGTTCIYRVPLTGGIMGTQVQVNNTVPANSQWMDIDPLGRFLYHANNGGVYGTTMFQINGSSSLISQGSLTISGTDMGSHSVFNADGTALYLVVPNVRTMAYSINPSTGVLSALSNDPTPPLAIHMHPKGTYVYAFDTGTSSARTYRVNADKSLTLTANQSVGGPSYDNVCMDRGGKFIFLTRITNPGAILSYRISDDGTLTLASSVTVSGSNQFLQCTTSIDSRTVWP